MIWKTGNIESAEISAVIHRGLAVTLPNGRPGRLAIVDADGLVIDASDSVAVEAFAVTISCYENFLIGKGHLRIGTCPPVQIVRSTTMQSSTPTANNGDKPRP